MTSTRHVSRWRLCRPPLEPRNSETSTTSSSYTAETIATVSPSTPPVSLRYLNEFVGKLHCAPALLQHGLFPDAKEVTESMALFNAVRRYIEPKNKGESLKENGKHDGIVVVGDGNTPRTAAMFAFRMRGWKCYSVDPAMEKGSNEIRLWVGDNSTPEGGNLNVSHADFSLASSVMKGCVRKELVEMSEAASGSTDVEKQSDDVKNRDGVLDFIGDTLKELDRDVSSMSQEELMAEEQTIGSSLSSAVASHLDVDTHVLALGWHPHRLAVRLLLRDGYKNVYTVSLTDELSLSINDERGTKNLKLQLHKCTVDLDTEREDESVVFEPCGYFTLQSSFALYSSEEEEKITVSFDNDGHPAPPLACVLDAGFIFRGFRGRAKKKPSFFRHVCRTLDQFLRPESSIRNASLICLTPRKQWRKKEFLAHVDLGYDVQSFIATRKQLQASPVYVYCCYKLQEMATVQPTGVGAKDSTMAARDDALETWLELEKELKARQSELDGNLVIIDSPEARVKAAQDQELAARDTTTEPRKVYVQVVGEITRVRRFSNGMAFLSLELAGSGYGRPLQVFLQRDTLNWSPETFTKFMTLLRKGDELLAVGFMARNARGHSMLQVEALSLARTGEYETYN
ncbi:Histone-lysine N-methyltransferase [Phytophthora nicotianae]|uniref:Histone-lysine N-methyltransferase n=1 Tax=Phytophthora nicotianae TaxID=4792 RepID=A0A0W8DRY9_PHYNI|nr:Histone-lysine N-methyltransferase [Phytophthora nicotianae]